MKPARLLTSFVSCLVSAAALSGPASALGEQFRIGANLVFDKLNQRFVTGMGMPVLVGEYASVARLSVDASQRYRTYWDQYVTSAARQRGLVPMYWDDGYSGNHTMGLFNRSNGTQYYPSLTSTIVNAR